MPNFSIGLTALRASQFALDTVSNNIANANTPGYHRRNVQFAALEGIQFGRHRFGNGVQVNHIERIRSLVTETSLTNAISDSARVDQTLAVERQIESILQPGDGSITQRLDNFFGELTKLASTPSEPTQRGEVIEQAEEMSRMFRRISSQLFELKTLTRYQLEREVETLNGHLGTLADLDIQIGILSATSDPNQELDQRDDLINKIGEIIDVSRNERIQGQTGISFGGTSIQQGISGFEFQTRYNNEDGSISVLLEDSETPTSLNGGRLPALLELHNETIPAFEQRLQDLAQTIIRQFDQVHATGTGSHGSFSILNAVRDVTDASVPLDQADLAFPVEAGQLFFSVVDSEGNRSTESIDIDPAVDSLNDVAQKISLLPNLTSNVNPQTNLIEIVGAPGYQFDFTGRLETLPELDQFSGTSIPGLSGEYNGAANDEFTFTVSGTGDVGISDDLFVTVTDAAGVEIGRVSIGQGYEAGTEVEVAFGVKVAFGSGTVADGDNFTSEMVNEPDSTGFLSAVGLNSFFQGRDAGSIAVSDEIRDDHSRFASGKTDENADTANLFTMIEIQHTRYLNGGTHTFTEALSEVSTDIGTRVQNNTQLSVALNGLKTNYEQERDSISGVDLNEEMIHLQQYQKSFEAAVRVIQTAESMLDELFTILR